MKLLMPDFPKHSFLYSEHVLHDFLPLLEHAPPSFQLGTAQPDHKHSTMEKM